MLCFSLNGRKYEPWSGHSLNTDDRFVPLALGSQKSNRGWGADSQFLSQNIRKRTLQRGAIWGHHIARNSWLRVVKYTAGLSRSFLHHASRAVAVLLAAAIAATGLCFWSVQRIYADDDRRGNGAGRGGRGSHQDYERRSRFCRIASRSFKIAFSNQAGTTSMLQPKTFSGTARQNAGIASANAWNC